jgi:hypothetical protein
MAHLTHAHLAGLTAQFLFTNFMSNIAQVELDFPAG